MEIQTEQKHSRCTLCLKFPETICHVINDDTMKMMALLLLKCDFKQNEQLIVCGKCEQDLKNCYEFKLLCLSTDDSIDPSARGDDCTKLDPSYANRRECDTKSNLLEDLNKCLLCLKLINHNMSTTLRDDKEDVKLRIQLNKYFPELVAKITENTSICSSCSISLDSFFSVMTNWSDAEGDIGKGIISEMTDNDLNIIPDFVPKTEYDNVAVGTDYTWSENEDRDGIKLFESLLNTEECSLTKPEVQENFSIKYEGFNQDSSEVSLYQCEKCEFKTKYKYHLKRHIVKHQDPSEVTTYYCEKCSYNAKFKHYIRQHMVTHDGPSKETIYQCDKCEYKTEHKNYLKRHVVVHQPSSKAATYQCEKCDYKAKLKICLRKHMVIHQDPSKITMYHCDKCDYKAKWKVSIRNHMAVHRDTPTYRCDKCEYKARLKSSLKRHMVSHQDPSEVTVYQCEQCDYKAMHELYLKRHMAMHRAPLQCDKCEYKASHKHSLKRHMVSHQDPSEVEIYECDKCNYKTKYRCYLKRHMEIHLNPAEAVVYQCESCEYKTTRQRNVRQHVLVHHSSSKATTY